MRWGSDVWEVSRGREIALSVSAPPSQSKVNIDSLLPLHTHYLSLCLATSATVSLFTLCCVMAPFLVVQVIVPAQCYVWAILQGLLCEQGQQAELPHESSTAEIFMLFASIQVVEGYQRIWRNLKAHPLYRCCDLAPATQIFRRPRFTVRSPSRFATWTMHS